MFTRLAKFRLVQPWRTAPGQREAVFSKDMFSASVFSRDMHSNDNLPGFRRPAATGKRRSPSPALACHWFDRNGRLECRWLAEPNDDAPLGDVVEYEHRTTGRVSGLSSTQPRGRGLALAG
jgi:hypothetical protein